MAGLFFSIVLMICAALNAFSDKPDAAAVAIYTTGAMLSLVIADPKRKP